MGDGSWGELDSKERRPPFSRDNGIYMTFGSKHLHFHVFKYGLFPSFLCRWNKYTGSLLYVHCLKWVIIPLDLLDTCEWKKSLGDSNWLVPSSVIICFSKNSPGHSRAHKIVFSVLLTMILRLWEFCFYNMKRTVSYSLTFDSVKPK